MHPTIQEKQNLYVSAKLRNVQIFVWNELKKYIPKLNKLKLFMFSSSLFNTMSWRSCSMISSRLDLLNPQNISKKVGHFCRTLIFHWLYRGINSPIIRRKRQQIRRRRINELRSCIYRHFHPVKIPSTFSTR